MRSFWITIACTLLGAAAGMATGVAYNAFMNPTPDGPLEAVSGLTLAEAALGWWLVGGALLGYLMSGAIGGLHGARRLGGKLLTLVVLALGSSVGAAVGIGLYLLLWAADQPDATILEGIIRIPAALADRADPAAAFVAAGIFAGFAVAVYARSRDLARRVAQFVTGAIIGALAGTIMYAFGYVLTTHPGLPQTTDYLLLFADALYGFDTAELVLAGLGALVGIAVSRYSWRLFGVFTLTSLVSVILGFFLYTLFVTFPRLAPDQRPFAIFLFIAEAGSLTMILLYSFYTLDVATRKRWQRAPRHALFSTFFLPRVEFHVPTYNEPPEIVLGTLRSILAVDYPEDRFRLVVLDDSTEPEAREPLEAFCKEHKVEYHRRQDRAGYKAGALNYGLKRAPEDVDLIAVVDADYVIEPAFLRETVGYFIDSDLAWIQTPQDYSNENQSFLTKQYYLADKHFYRTVLPSRNEENSIIFCGTMGILRREAIDAVGGWGEKYITEDAELSVRLLAQGWKSLYVNKTYGHGLIPPTFDGYKKQHRRWAFGGGQVLRGHFLSIFFGRLSARQRLDYLIGNLHWFEGLFILAISLGGLAMAWGDLSGYEVVNHHSGEIFLLGLVPWFLLVDGFARLHMVLRRHLGLTFGGTLRVMGMWFSVKFSNCLAALKGAIGFRMGFVRTSKFEPTRMRPWPALRRGIALTRFESSLAIIFWATSILMGLRIFEEARAAGIVLARGLLALWLVYYALLYSAAPLYAARSYTTFQSTQPLPETRSAVAQVPL